MHKYVTFCDMKRILALFFSASYKSCLIKGTDLGGLRNKRFEYSKRFDVSAGTNKQGYLLKVPERGKNG